MPHPTQAALLAHLTALLTEGHAHITLEAACADLTPAEWNARVPAAPYTIWQLLEHLRIAQWDILEFSRDAGHASPEWPAGYWPAADATADAALWQATLAALAADRKQFLALLQTPDADLFAPLAHGTGQTLLREALLIADHNAYHTGEIVLLRRLLGAW